MTPELQPLGRALIFFGVILAGFGLLLLMVPKIPWLGRLPGDFLIQRGRFSFYVPLASCLAASLLLSVLLWVIGRFRR
ncbi:MAG: DUF2905 domain-containing protein [Candidatus Omnitrophota bacterium]|nr:DUF2905 domain-containing protein [Candidatus Omnitrophota bacterium]